MTTQPSTTTPRLHLRRTAHRVHVTLHGTARDRDALTNAFPARPLAGSPGAWRRSIAGRHEGDLRVWAAERGWTVAEDAESS